MPAPRAVLIDLERHGLNPRKHQSELSDNGHLKATTPMLKAKKAAIAADKTTPADKLEVKLADLKEEEVVVDDDVKSTKVEAEDKKPTQRVKQSFSNTKLKDDK